MSEQPPSIHVIAGVNGAGKSSIGGASIREANSLYYNPDEAARKFLAVNPELTQAEANSAAWHEGVRLLIKAIDKRLDFAFESTLGGNTIPRLLREAAAKGIRVSVWYVGLRSPELHIERVQRRVRRGGHDIPEENIRRRYVQSRLNLIQLLPHLTRLQVFDNSTEGDPGAEVDPDLRLILQMEEGKVIGQFDLADTPAWARDIVEAAINMRGQSS